MEIRKNLELIEVEYKDSSVIMTFLDEERGEIRDVKFNKQNYKDGKFVDDAEKAEKVEEWCKEYFDLTFDTMNQAVGVRKDIYCYDRYNSLWESTDSIEKFKKEDEGEIISTTIEEVVDDGIGIRIRYKYNDKLHESKMMYAIYSKERNQWFVDPQKKVSQYERFNKKFGFDVDACDAMIGKEIMVEVKKAFNSYYGDIKKPKWTK